MKIVVEAKPNAKKSEVIKINEGNFRVSVKEPPADGKANLAIIEALSGYFKVARSNIRIISGQNYRKKLIEINKSHE
ncbi:DUF167 domain-containing protein [Candidatus Giovannonibacteria bacterium]|nr:DUF167 domain-containing protein [Candidatus Giovannonibacteria bacterium]